MKLVSFSLFGVDTTYTVGALENVKMYADMLPDYTCTFYVGSTVPERAVERLVEAGATIQRMGLREDWNATLWRFLALKEQDVSHMHFRDADSRPLKREILAIRDWENSGIDFHAMRDHPGHAAPVMAGMWGCTARGAQAIRDFLPDINRIRPSWDYHEHIDQHWLATAVWQHFRRNSMIHASFWINHFGPTVQFPLERTGEEFVGQALDANGNDRYPQPAPLADLCSACKCAMKCERRL